MMRPMDFQRRSEFLFGRSSNVGEDSSYSLHSQFPGSVLGGCSNKDELIAPALLTPASPPDIVGTPPLGVGPPALSRDEVALRAAQAESSLVAQRLAPSKFLSAIFGAAYAPGVGDSEDLLDRLQTARCFGAAEARLFASAYDSTILPEASHSFCPGLPSTPTSFASTDGNTPDVDEAASILLAAAPVVHDDSGIVYPEQCISQTLPISPYHREEFFSWRRLQSIVDFKPVYEFLESWDLHAYALRGRRVALIGVAAYLVWRWYHDSKVRFDERGSVFTGTQTMPVCLHCNPDLLTICTIKVAHTRYKKFHIPYACSRCSLLPSLYGAKPSIIGLTTAEYQCITCYGMLNKAKTRDIHSSLTNILDSSTDYTTREAFLNMHFQALNEKEQVYNSYLGAPFYDYWTDSYVQATHWLAVPAGAVAREFLLASVALHDARPVVPPTAAPAAEEPKGKGKGEPKGKGKGKMPAAPAAPMPQQPPPAPPPPPTPPPYPPGLGPPPPLPQTDDDNPTPSSGSNGASDFIGDTAANGLEDPMPAASSAVQWVEGKDGYGVTPGHTQPTPPGFEREQPGTSSADPNGSAEVFYSHKKGGQFRFQAIHRMRSIWQWTTDHLGEVPQMAIIKSNFSLVRDLVKVGEPYENSWFNRSVHYNALNTGAQPLEPNMIDTWSAKEDCWKPGQPLVGPKDHVVWFTSNFKAFKLGPILSFFSVWDTKLTTNILSLLQGRTKPAGIYNRESDCSRRIGRLYSVFKEKVLARKRVMKAYREVMEEVDGDITKLLSKFSQEQIDQAIAEMEVSPVHKIPKRKYNGKNEGVAQTEEQEEGKYMRGIVDNKLYLLAINVLAGKILEHMTFYKPDDMKTQEANVTRDQEINRPSTGSAASCKIGTREGGIFSRMCIKLEDRAKVLDKIIRECSHPVKGEKVMVGEVDQTKMELSTRCSKVGEGLMGHFLGLLQHINTIIAPTLQATLVGLHGAKLVADIKSGMTLQIFLDGRMLRVQFKDMYLDSGWLLTSLMNFINELFATYAAHVLDPEKLFTQRTNNNPHNRFRIEEGTHNFIFKSIPLPQVEADGSPTMVVTIVDGVKIELPAEDKPFVVYFRGWFEGDDGVFRLSRIFWWGRALVEANYKDAGYGTKLKYVIDGRAEYVGAHVVVVDGLTNPKIPWVPAIGRYLLKIGLNCSSNPTPADNAARAASLAIMFGGRIQIFACMFQSLLHSILAGIPGSTDGLVVHVSAYSIESRVLSEGKHTLASIVETTRQAVAITYPDPKVQLMMIENSFELPPGSITTHDLNKLEQLSEIITCDMDDEVAYGYLPASMMRR